MASPGLEVVECDDAGNFTCSYVETESLQPARRSRVDIIVRMCSPDARLRRFRVRFMADGFFLKLPKHAKSYAQQLLDVFLPAGYPQSVTEDYIQ
jgi:hypothetical protein